jgi:hypothetical protein
MLAPEPYTEHEEITQKEDADGSEKAHEPMVRLKQRARILRRSLRMLRRRALPNWADFIEARQSQSALLCDSALRLFHAGDRLRALLVFVTVLVLPGLQIVFGGSDFGNGEALAAVILVWSAVCELPGRARRTDAREPVSKKIFWSIFAVEVGFFIGWDATFSRSFDLYLHRHSVIAGMSWGFGLAAGFDISVTLAAWLQLVWPAGDGSGCRNGPAAPAPQAPAPRPPGT